MYSVEILLMRRAEGGAAGARGCPILRVLCEGWVAYANRDAGPAQHAFPPIKMRSVSMSQIEGSSGATVSSVVRTITIDKIDLNNRWANDESQPWRAGPEAAEGAGNGIEAPIFRIRGL